MPDSSTIATVDVLEPGRAEEVRALLARAEAADGRAPLNEAAQLAVRHQGRGLRHVLLLEPGGRVLAYGQLAAAETETSASLVVDPDRRRAGLGTRLLNTLLELAPDLRVWAHRGTPGSEELALRLRLTAVRELLIMGRSLADPVPAAEPPDGIALRTFDPATDIEPWLGVNARAFATHPEQGSITRADLQERMAEPWFDPAGFFVAVRTATGGTDELVGFHWTKQQPEHVGEVYVLGVDPASGVRGLGTPLLLRGLDHLRGAGNTSVILYVEADNAPARKLYARTGFTVTAADVQYQRVAHASAAVTSAG